MKSWYEFRGKSGAKETEILLYDEIGGFGISASQFIAELQSVPASHRLVLRIHSPGGSVLDGNAIANAIKRHPGGVTTHVDGLAASMASVLAITGAPANMAANGLLMVHNVSGGQYGDAEDLRRTADLLDKVQETIVEAYAERTGKSRKAIREMMDAETWMNAKEAKEAGFIDAITAEVQIAAKFDLSKFRNASRFDTGAFSNSHKPFSAMIIETPEFLALKAEHESAKARFQKLDTDFQAITKEKLELTAGLEKRTAEAVASAAEVTALKASAEKMKADHATALGEFEKKVDLAAAVKMAALGAQPLALGSEGAAAGNRDADLYDKFSKADPTEAHAMFTDPAINARLRIESARRHKAAPAL